MKKAFRKAFAVTLSATLALSVLAGCGSSDSGSSSGSGTSAEAGSGDSADAASEGSGKTDLQIIYTAEPSSLLPGQEAVSNGHMIQCNIYDTLVMEDPADRTNIIPGLAESWEYSEDGTTITFTLRQGVKFHDGTEMTADDVVFSLQKDAEGSYNASAAELIDSIEKVDDTHVAVKTKYAYKPFLEVLAMPSFGIYSQAWYEQCEADGTNLARSENGTGPYKFVEWQSGDYIKLEANEDYWGGAPEIKTVTLKYMADGTTAALSMERGDADFFVGLNTSDREHIEASDSCYILDVPSNGTHYLAYNTKDGFFTNKDARKAVQYSLNREDILTGGLDGIGTVTPYMVNPDHFGYVEDWEPTPYDVDQAKSLLEGIGYDGTPITFKTANDSWYQKPAQVISEQMRQAGFNVDLQIMERGAWEEDVDANGNSEIWNYMTWGQFPDADADVYMYLHTSMQGIAYANMSYAGNEECDALLDQARYSLDDEERIELYRQIADICEEEGWYSFLITGSNPVVVSNELEGVNAHAAQFYKFNGWSFK